MSPAAEARILTVLAFLVTAILSVWIGGSVIVDSLVVPTAFESLPREDAADVGRAIFHRFNFAECLLGAAAVLLSFAMGRIGWGTKRRHLTATVVLNAMTVIALVYLLVLTPAIVDRLEELRDAGVNLDDETQMPPERVALRQVHAAYGALEVLKVLGGVAVLWLLASRKRI